MSQNYLMPSDEMAAINYILGKVNADIPGDSKLSDVFNLTEEDVKYLESTLKEVPTQKVSAAIDWSLRNTLNGRQFIASVFNIGMRFGAARMIGQVNVTLK